MTDEEIIEQQLNHYSQLFDHYVDQPSPPSIPPEGTQDPLLDYLQEVLADPSNFLHAREDFTWRELFKSSLLNFFTAMLKSFLALEREQHKEMQILQAFFDANIESRRKQWSQILAAIQEKYSPAEVNTYGFIQQFQESDISQKESIFEAMRQQWMQASQHQLLNAKRKCLRQNKQIFESSVKNAGSEDYEIIYSLEKVFFKYPLLKEIVNLIGREQVENSEEKDSTITKYIPILFSHAKTIAEVDGVTIGNTIQQALPSETVYLSDKDTEDIFFHRFATNQLQQLASKPPTMMKQKTDHIREQQPRLTKGPIIVSVDTSGSMYGTPLQVATSLLLQLLQLAKKQKRCCYLITYSVRAQAIDLAHPANWRQVRKFLQYGFSGGTDGNEMLQHSINILQNKRYAMADVLIISDFEWYRPQKEILTRMNREKQQGTKFYGLGICANRMLCEHDWLDKLWNITHI